MAQRIGRRNLAWLRVLAAEAWGTFMIVLSGCGSVAASFTGAYKGIFQVAVVWGLGVAFAIYQTEHISGAHLNPAVSLTNLFWRPESFDFPRIFGGPRKQQPLLSRGPAWRDPVYLKRCAQFVLAQYVGAIAAGAVNLWIHGPSIRAFERGAGLVRGEESSILTASAFGEYFPNPGMNADHVDGGFFRGSDVDVWRALATEAAGTFLLVVHIYGLTHGKRVAANPALKPAIPFLIGFFVCMLLMLFAPYTQAGWNPARDFGPRLVAFLAGWGPVALPGRRHGWWIYQLGPLIGAFLGGAFSDYTLYGESDEVQEADGIPGVEEAAV